MLYAFSRLAPGTEPICCAQWRVGEKVPDVPVERIVELQADGDELEYIENIFSLPCGSYGVCSIPIAHTNRISRWYGDIARTIYLNL
jgi:hypothetical protein